MEATPAMPTNELFAVAQQVEDQITNTEQMGESMPRQRRALADLLNDILCPKRKPLVLGRNEAVKEVLRKAALEVRE